MSTPEVYWDLFTMHRRSREVALETAACMIREYELTLEWRKAMILRHLAGKLTVGVTNIEPAAIPVEGSDLFYAAFAVTIGDRCDVCPLEFHTNDGWLVGFRHPQFGNVDLYGNGDYREVFASALSEFHATMSDGVARFHGPASFSATLP